MPWQLHVCDVHRLVDGDLTEYESQYCSRCDSWICKDCQHNVLRRAQAMMFKQKELIAARFAG